MYNLWIKNFVEIALSRTVSEIKVFLYNTQKFSTYTLQVKNFAKMAMSCTISEINAFLHFMQKFNMAVKNGRKTTFGKKLQITLHIPCRSKISFKSLYLAPSSR